MKLRVARAPLLLISAFHRRLLFSTEFTWFEAPRVYEKTLPLRQLQAGASKVSLAILTRMEAPTDKASRP